MFIYLNLPSTGMKLLLIIALIVAIFVAVTSQISSSPSGSCGVSGTDLHWEFGGPLTYAEANLKSNDRTDCSFSEVSIFGIQRMERASVEMEYATLFANMTLVSAFYLLLLLPLLLILKKAGIKKALMICGASALWFILGGLVSLGLNMGSAFSGDEIGILGWLILLTISLPATLAYFVADTINFVADSLKLPGILLLGWAIAIYISLGINQFLAMRGKSG